ncbi:MAG: hypothetical protein P8Y10_15800 [Gemmatimonadales bacterium]
MISCALHALPAHAQDDRSLTTPVDWWWYDGVSPETIGQLVDAHGARITDIEVEQTSPLLFSVVLVKNEGPYARRWWWYYDLSGQQVEQSLAEERARISDIELMAVRPDARFAVVLVENSGEQAKLANWTAGAVNAANAGDYVSGLSGAGMRLADFDPNDRMGGYVTTVELADEIARTGAWWWYPDLTADEIAHKLTEHNARLVDIEWKAGNRFGALMVGSGGEAWSWYYDLTDEQVDKLAQQDAARIIDIETRTVNGRKRFAAIMLQRRSLPVDQVQMSRAAAAAAAGRTEPARAERVPTGNAVGQIRPQPAAEADQQTSTGYICQVQRTGATPSLRVTLTTRTRPIPTARTAQSSSVTERGERKSSRSRTCRQPAPFWYCTASLLLTSLDKSPSSLRILQQRWYLRRLGLRVEHVD